jgi:putative membrane protein
MREIHYSEFSGEKPVLRDFLAIDRTVLANERTVLAYLRTALAFAVVGASAIKFFDSVLYETLGGLFILFGVIVAAVGARRFIRVQKRIEEAIALGAFAVEHKPTPDQARSA